MRSLQWSWKAIDTVNHKILLSKLDHYGIRDNALKWLTSYLNNRKQYVKLNGSQSKHGNICCGVPQGSILFTIYINDMHQTVTSSKMHHFAYDTNLLFSNKNNKLMAKILNQEFKSVFEWLCANRLTINVSKTEFIIFKPPKKPLNQRIVLKLNGNKIF